LFILLNAVLFIRPAEIIPAVQGWSIYEAVILACLAASFPEVLRLLSPDSLARQPITVCVLGLLPAIVLSHVAHFDLYSARMTAFDFFKVVVYYLLLIANISSASRLRQFLAWLVILIGILTLLAVLQYHEVIQIPGLSALQQLQLDDAEGESFILRLQSTGPFNDPNDLCLILLTGMGLCLYWITNRGYSLLRLIAIFPLALFGFAMGLTYSRGGFLALMLGLLYLVRSRFGWGKTILISILVVPGMFMLFAGRQTQIDIGDRNDTAQARIQLWSEGLELFRESPVFGIGKEEYAEVVQHVAHNSFLHSFTELGIVGGTLFLGTFFCSFVMLHRLTAAKLQIADPQLRYFLPFLAAIIIAYAVGLLSLSRSYVVTTYLILGLVAAFVRVATIGGRHPVLTFDLKLLGRLGIASVAYLACIYSIVRIFT
jgi:O-antigen ligase